MTFSIPIPSLPLNQKDLVLDSTFLLFVSRFIYLYLVTLIVTYLVTV